MAISLGGKSIVPAAGEDSNQPGAWCPGGGGLWLCALVLWGVSLMLHSGREFVWTGWSSHWGKRASCQQLVRTAASLALGGPRE